MPLRALSILLIVCLLPACDWFEWEEPNDMMDGDTDTPVTDGDNEIDGSTDGDEDSITDGDSDSPVDGDIEADIPEGCQCARGTRCCSDGCHWDTHGTPCNDNNLCTFNDQCERNHQCVGTPYTCDTPGFCETAQGATCNGDGSCSYPAAEGDTCNDQESCTHTDLCQRDKSCAGTGYACESPGFCETAEGAICDGAGGCSYPADEGAVCDDEESCTHTDQCQPDKSCEGTAYTCETPGFCEQIDGATCLGDGSCNYPVQTGHCLIGETCPEAEEANPANVCEVCAPDTSQTDWTARPDTGFVCDDEDDCSTASECVGGVCTGTAFVENDCTEYIACGQSPNGCYSCGECIADTQICWECDSTTQSCWPGEDIDTKICAPDQGGSCGDMSGLQAGSPWPMFGGCPTHQGKSQYYGPEEPTLRWAFKTEDWVRSSPVISSDGTIYVGCGNNAEPKLGYFYAIHPDGTEYWRVPISSKGVYISSALIDHEGHVYIGGFEKNLYAFYPDGSPKWTFETPKAVISSPVIGNQNVLYFACDEKLYAVGTNGEELWSESLNAGTRSSPVIGENGTIYVGSDAIYAFSPDGEQVWASEAGNYIYSNPSIGRDGTIYAGTFDQYIRAIDPEAEILWEFGAGGNVTSAPAIANDGSLYFGTYNGAVHGLNPDGSVRWSYNEANMIYGSATIDSAGRIFIGSTGNRMNALNSNGQLNWQYTTGDMILSSPSIGSDETLFFGSDDQYLYALGPCREGDPCMEDKTIGFDGISSHVTLADDYLFRPHDIGTLELWFRWDGPSEAAYLWEVLYGESDPQTVALKVYDNGVLDYREQGPSWNVSSPSGSVVPGRWHHIAVVKQTGSATLYLDGRNVGQVSFTPETFTPVNSPITHLGWNPNDDAQGYFKGHIDEVRISDTVRYTEDFTPAFRFEPDEHTIGLWHFDVGRDDAVFAAHGQLPPGSLEGTASRTGDGEGVERDWIECVTGWSKCGVEAGTILSCGQTGEWSITENCPPGDTCVETAAYHAECASGHSSFIPIQAGTFWMGSPDGVDCPEGYPGECINEPGRGGDETLHEVTLTYDFEIMKYEVSQNEWISMTTWNPSTTGNCPNGTLVNCPLEMVSWYDALAYANIRSELSGFIQCYEFSDVVCEDGSAQDTDFLACMNENQGGIESASVSIINGLTKPQQCSGYRLPTDAEWEYAIRSGNQYSALYRSNGNDGTLTMTQCEQDVNLNQIAWYCGNSTWTQPRGLKAGNDLGLFDMSGNVSEWTWDKYCSDNTGLGIDPEGGICDATYRVLRGGAMRSDARVCRSSNRASFLPGFRNFNIGFRLVRSLHPESK